ncbi:MULTISPECIES: hypothetical protein [Streptomyces]|nr:MULTISPECIES: hypothetical protein [Streptomyces]
MTSETDPAGRQPQGAVHHRQRLRRGTGPGLQGTPVRPQHR